MATLSGGGFVTAPPQADELPTSSQSTLLLEKKKEMAEVQQQLDRKKEEFRQRMQRCQEKEVELAAKQEAIKEQVRKFDKFLKDNDAKRVRANRKAFEEIKVREAKESEKLLLAEELKKQLSKKKELSEELDRKAVYEKYLEHVCEHTEYFEDIENVLKRYETLEAANQDLRSRVEAAQGQAEDASASLAAFVKSSQTESLVFNSQIASRQQQLDSLRLEAQDNESDLHRKENDVKDCLRQLGEISMAIQNIYLRCHVRGPPVPESDERLALYLSAVQQRVNDLQAIEAEHRGARTRGALNSGGGGGTRLDETPTGRTKGESSLGTQRGAVGGGGAAAGAGYSTANTSLPDSAKLPKMA